MVGSTREATKECLGLELGLELGLAGTSRILLELRSALGVECSSRVHIMSCRNATAGYHPSLYNYT